MRKSAKVTTAKRLRSEMTKPEVWLWARLRKRHPDGLTFRRQHALGPYILDFYCAEAKLAVEVDGEIHTREFKQKSDARRDACLNTQGIEVHRIHAGDLLAAPDDVAQGVYDLATERLQSLGNAPSVTPSA